MDTPSQQEQTPAQHPASPTNNARAAPKPAYTKPPIDTALYARIASTTARKLTYTHTLPPRSGHAWTVPAGHILRLSTPEGPQVGDLNLWNAHNARERFWAARTRQLQSSHVSTGDRLWSCLPYLRPMVTIVQDSLVGFGVSEFGARCHDLLGTRCDPYVNTLLTNTTYNNHCHSNLTRAILPYHLSEADVHDVLNVFQVTGLDASGRYFMEPSPAVAGSFIDFFAEQDLLCALSTCPGGDLSAWGWETDEVETGTETGASGSGHGNGSKAIAKESMRDTCRPIKIEVFEIEDMSVLHGWSLPPVAGYRGMHGMTVPRGE